MDLKANVAQVLRRLIPALINHAGVPLSPRQLQTRIEKLIGTRLPLAAVLHFCRLLAAGTGASLYADAREQPEAEAALVFGTTVSSGSPDDLSEPLSEKAIRRAVAFVLEDIISRKPEITLHELNLMRYERKELDDLYSDTRPESVILEALGQLRADGILTEAVKSLHVGSSNNVTSIGYQVVKRTSLD